MPKGPKGEKRPADTNSCAVTIAKIATGEMEDNRHETPNRRKSGLAGAKARNASLTEQQRSEIASKGAAARWRKSMGTSVDVAKNRLFGDGSLGVADIKLFPGTDRDVTPQGFAAEILRVIAEMEVEARGEGGEDA